MYEENKRQIFIFSVFTLILAGLFFLTPQKLPTGALAFEQQEITVFNVNKTFNESTTIELNFTNASSLKISGKFQGESARVYAEENNTLFLVFDSGKITNNTFFAPNETTYQNSSFDAISEGAIFFLDACSETCNLKLESPKLQVVLRGNTYLTISNITYFAQQKKGELKQIKQIPDFEIADEGIINFKEFFVETNNAKISYAITPLHDVRAVIFEDQLKLFARKPGSYTAQIIATNGEQMITSNSFNIIVNAAPKSKIEDIVEQKLLFEEEVPVIIEFNSTQFATTSQNKKSKLHLEKETFHALNKVKNKKSNSFASFETTSTNSSTEANSFFNSANVLAQKDYDYEIEKEFDNLPLIAVKLTRQGIAKLRNNSAVSAIHFDKNLSISLSESVSIVRADIAQNLSYSNTQVLGQGQTICILDTGIDLNHSAFAGRILPGKNFIGNNDDATDDNGHGTHVAGIAGANSTFVGIAPRANILPIKVCDSNGNCPSSAILGGIDYCINNSAKFNISSISGSFADGGEYNSTNCPTLFDGALSAANEQNITNVFASGNNYYSNGVSYPACSPFSIAVGASTKQDTLALFTNRGELLDILAPGDKIISTIPGNNYGEKSGTSISAPFVSGAVVLIAQKQKLQNLTLSPAQIEQLLKETAEKSIEGVPRLDVYRAVSGAGQNSINASPPIFTSTEIIFKQPVDWANFSSCSNISFNHAQIYSEKCPQYNKSAQIIFRGLPWAEAWLLRDGASCAGITCFNTTYSYGTLVSDVLNFGNYFATGTGEIIFEQQQKTPGFPTEEPPFEYGLGQNGSLIIAAGTTVVLNTSTTGANPTRKGGYNFTNIVIAAGGVLTVPAQIASAPLLIRVLGDVNISGNISIGGGNGIAGAVAGGFGAANGSRGGTGGAENAQGTAGGGPGAGQQAFVGAVNTAGGSGAGHATAGGNSSGAGGRAGGASYNNADITSPDIDGMALTVATGGSGGGGGSGGITGGGTRTGGAGGGGGGAIKIIAGGVINVAGVINATGGSGTASGHTTGGCGGGGSGGSIILAAPRIILSGVLNVSGGKGGTTTCVLQGGNASAGRIRLHYENLTLATGQFGLGKLDITGNGSAAANVGGRGTNVSYPFIGCGSDIVGDVNLSFAGTNGAASSARNVTCKPNSTQPYILRLQKRNVTTTNPGVPMSYTVDCLGVNLTGNGSGSNGVGRGIIINTSNVILRNCNLANLTTGILVNTSANNTIQNVNITNSTFGINIDNSSNTQLISLTLGTETRPLASTSFVLFNSSTTIINNSRIGNYSITTTNLTIGTSDGRIEFTRNITQTNNTNLTGFPRSDINISINYTFVNTTNKKGFNVTANLTFFGLTGFTTPQAIVSFADTGVFETCAPTICSTPVYDAGSGRVDYQVKQFTTFFVNETYAPPTSSCGTVTQSTTLISNVLDNGGNCFNFNASNILFDCVGYNITSNPQGREAFNATTFVSGSQVKISNITIQNCNVFNFSVGVNFSSVNDSKILGNNITNVSTAIAINNSDLIVINNNLANATDKSGIYLSNVTNSTISFNNASNNFGTSTGAGILVNASSDNRIENNTLKTVAGLAGLHLELSYRNNITNNFARADGAAFGIKLDIGASNNVLLNNTGVSSAAASAGIAVYQNYDNTFTNNTADTTASASNIAYAFYLWNANNTNLTGNNIISNNGPGLVFETTSTKNYLIKNTATSTFRYGIWIKSGSVNNTFINNTFGGNVSVFIDAALGWHYNEEFINTTVLGNTGFEINGSTNISIKNSVFQDVNWSIKTIGSNVSFIDTARATNYSIKSAPKFSAILTDLVTVDFFNISSANGTNFSRDINLSINRTHVNSSRSPGLNASNGVTANITFYGLVGVLAPQIVVDYFDSGAFEECTSPKCTILVPYASNSIKFNVSSFTTYAINNTLPSFPCGIVNESKTMTGVAAATGGSCFDFNQSNILFDCAGWNVTSNPLGGVAFNISVVNGEKLSNITIQNCNIRNFSIGINISSANKIKIIGNNVTNVSDGIWLNNTNESILQNNYVNSSFFTINLVNSSNNTLTLNNLTKSTGTQQIVFLGLNSRNNVISNNVINTRANAHGIVLNGALVNNNIIIENDVLIAASGSPIYLLTAGNTSVIKNKLELTGVASTAPVVAVQSARDSMIINNTIISTAKGIFASQTAFSNFFYNNTIKGHPAVYETNSKSDVYANNTIFESNTGFEINATANVTIANSSFQDVNWSIKTGLGSNISLIDNERMTNYTFNTTPRLTIKKTGQATVDFFNIIQANGTNLSMDVNLSTNFTHVNSSRSPGLNVSANITLFGLSFTSPQIIVDFEDDGVFEYCNFVPGNCTNLSYSSGTFIFNVSSFSTYAVNETFVPGGNTPPTINRVWFDTSVTPQENKKSGFNITINFTANDADGAANLADVFALAYITNNSIVKTSSPVNCTMIPNNASSRNYSCQINITYYQPAGIWNITVNISDAAAAMASNATEKFTLNALTAIIVNNSFNNSPIDFYNIKPGEGNQRANTTLGIDNVGNVNISSINITAFDVWNLTAPGIIVINASNFSVSVHELAIGPPDVLRNNTNVTITNSSIAVDSDAADYGNRTFYFFINVSNILPGRYNASRLWEVQVN